MPPRRAGGGSIRQPKGTGFARLTGNWRDQFASLKSSAGTNADWVAYLVGGGDSQLGVLAKGLKEGKKYKGQQKVQKLRQLADDIGVPRAILALDPSRDEWPGPVFTASDDERLRELLTPVGQARLGYVERPRGERGEPSREPPPQEERKYGRTAAEEEGPVAAEEETAAAEEEPAELEPFGEFAAASEFARPGRHVREVNQLLEALQGAEARGYRSMQSLRQLRREALEVSLGARLDKPEQKSLLAQLQALAVNRFAEPGSEYRYVGSQTDLLGNIEDGVAPINELDEAARWHDFEYLKIAAERARGEISDGDVVERVGQADRVLADAADNIVDRRPKSLEADAARLVRSAMTIKAAAGRVLPTWVGVATPLTREEVEEREADVHNKIVELFSGEGALEDWPHREAALQAAVRLAHEIASEGEEHARARSEIEGKEGAPGAPGAPGSGGGGAVGGGSVAIGAPTTVTAAAAAPASLASSPEAAAAGGAVRGESRYTSIGAQGAVDMLGTKIQGFLPEPAKPTMLQPVTGERVLALSVPIGDSPDVVALTAKERMRADTFYSRFKNVASGMGNGNQQLMPWEVAHRTNNSLIDAVSGNERVKYSGPQFTGGATLPVVKMLGKQDRVAFRVQMISDKSGPTAFLRDSPATAARGREIQMSSEQMPDSILTQKQWLNSMGQRLVRPSVTAGRRN